MISQTTVGRYLTVTQSEADSLL